VVIGIKGDKGSMVINKGSRVIRVLAIRVLGF
jgi:hypothetical protein